MDQIVNYKRLVLIITKKDVRINKRIDTTFNSHKHQHNKILSDVELALEINSHNDKKTNNNSKNYNYNTDNDSIHIIEGGNTSDQQETKLDLSNDNVINYDNKDIKLHYVNYYHDHIMEWDGKKYNRNNNNNRKRM